MSDWTQLVGNAVWIVGVALALAVVSYAGWQASLRRQSLSAMLGLRTYALLLDLAGILLSSGLLITSQKLLEKGVWALVGVGFLIQAWLTFRGRRAPR